MSQHQGIALIMGAFGIQLHGEANWIPLHEPSGDEAVEVRRVWKLEKKKQIILPSGPGTGVSVWHASRN